MIDKINALLNEDAKVKSDPFYHELFIAKFLKEKNGFYVLNENYRIGKIDTAQNGVGYLETFGAKTYKKDLLIEPKDLNSAQKGDIVVAKRLFSKSKRASARVVKILKRAFEFSIVYTEKVGQQIVGINIKNALRINISASQKSLKLLPPRSVLKINNNTNVIEEVLGVLDDDLIDEKISLALFNKTENFSLQALNEAQSYGDSVDKSMYDCTDLTHLDFCTIDPNDAKDYDDAIYFDEKSYTLYVAIADVSSYVSPYSAMDKEARIRGFSIYFPHKSIPMLPRNLSENICSLKPNEDRLAFCFKITIDKATLKVKKEELFNAIINSKCRFTYDEIDHIFKTNKAQTPFSWLFDLKKLTDHLRSQRLQNAFEFCSDEVRMNVDEKQKLISTTIEIETPSHKLVEDCMLLANKAAAKRLEKGIFRNHESPSFEKIDSLLEDLRLIGLDFNFNPHLPDLIRDIQKKADDLNIRSEVDKLIIKSQKKACYSHENKGHFGLGFSKYSHFTSPIRRYSDLVLHRLLKAQIANDKKLFSYQLENINELCKNLSDLERESDRVAFDYMDRKFARWANEHVGENYEAIVVSVKPNEIIAKLDDKIKGAKIILLCHDAYLLDRILVQIVSVNIAKAMIFAKPLRVL